MPYAVGEYYEHADEYDLEYQSQSEQDLPFWKELVMRYLPRRVLELACGSGRIGLELLHGPGDFLLEGVDISQEMLAAYERKLRSEERRVGKECRSLCDWSSDVCSSDLWQRAHWPGIAAWPRRFLAGRSRYLARDAGGLCA